MHIVIVSTAWQNTGHDVVECNCTLKLVAPVSLPTVLTYLHGQQQGKEQKQNHPSGYISSVHFIYK